MSDRGTGYYTLCDIRGIPVFVHWSLPFGGLLISVYVGFKLEQVFYYTIGYFLLVVIHEFGHVAAARFAGLKVYSVEITGVGGLCRFDVPHRVRDAFLLYFGGILAQLVLFMAAYAYLNVLGYPAATFGRCLINTFLIVNVLMIVMNIIPYKEKNGLASDGYHLWFVFIYALKRAKQPAYPPKSASRTFPPDTSLLRFNGFTPANFTVGVEILNDDTTPMEFVVSALTHHFQLSREDAFKMMLEIHKKGGVIVPLENMKSAESIVQRIAEETRAHHHHLVCRAVSV